MSMARWLAPPAEGRTRGRSGHRGGERRTRESKQDAVDVGNNGMVSRPWALAVNGQALNVGPNGTIVEEAMRETCHLGQTLDACPRAHVAPLWGVNTNCNKPISALIGCLQMEPTHTSGECRQFFHHAALHCIKERCSQSRSFPPTTPPQCHWTTCVELPPMNCCEDVTNIDLYFLLTRD